MYKRKRKEIKVDDTDSRNIHYPNFVYMFYLFFLVLSANINTYIGL